MTAPREIIGNGAGGCPVDSERPGQEITPAGPFRASRRLLRLDDLCRLEQALKLTTTALHNSESWMVRGRCVDQTDLAITHLLGRDLEQAAAFGRDALRTAADVDSTIILERLRTLQRQVHPLRSASPILLDLDDRITGFLARTTRRQPDNNSF